MLAYMMAGYIIIWLLAFVFVFNMWNRSRRLERDLESVRVMVDRLERE